MMARMGLDVNKLTPRGIAVFQETERLFPSERTLLERILFMLLESNSPTNPDYKKPGIIKERKIYADYKDFKRAMLPSYYPEKEKKEQEGPPLGNWAKEIANNAT